MVNQIGDVIEIIEREPEIYNILKCCPYKVLKEITVVRSRTGEFVLSQGSIYDSFYIVVSGAVGIYVMAENGRKYTLTVYKKGNFIGEHEIFDLKPYSSFVEAISDVVLLELKREPFLKWLSLDRNISDSITRSLCRQIYQLSQKAGTDTLYTLRQRVCQYLISAIGKDSKLAIDKESLSERMGVTPRSINRILKDLRDEQLIEISNSSIQIRNLEALKLESEIKST